jgi:hypothetical protein
VRPNKGTTFPQSSTGTLVVLRYPTQNSWDFLCKMLRDIGSTILTDFSTGCGGCPQIWRFYYLKSPLYKCKKVSSLRLWSHWPEWTSTHQQRTIHGMPVITQFWMNVNWVNIWFNLGNQFCKK